MKVSLFIQECGSHSTYIHSMRKEHWITLSQHVTVLNGLSIKGIGGGTRDSGGACSQHNRRSSHNKHQCHRKAYRVCLADRNSLGRPLRDLCLSWVCMLGLQAISHACYVLVHKVARDQ